MNICFNGNHFPSDTFLFTAQNRSFKYGDGLFETMKIYKAVILLENYHFERLFLSLKILDIEFDTLFDPATLRSSILNLCFQNNCSNLARVRLAVFRNEENKAEYVIEAVPLSYGLNNWNEKGLRVDFCPYAKKSTDALSNLKTSNFLIYVLADRFAKEKNLDDSIVLNTENKICDTSKANIFLMKKGEIYTPALSQGCINGVMRRFLIEETKRLGYAVHQKEIEEHDLYDAEEAFLTNAIIGMKWVKNFREKEYECQNSFSIYNSILSNLYQ